MSKYAALFALSVTLVGCATEPSKCEQAAAALAECTGSVPDGFIESCESDTEGETIAFTDSLLESTCDQSALTGGKEDGLFETAFVSACSAMVGSAYITNRLRSPALAPLPQEMKDVFRAEFGSLVDTVRVSWNARLVDDWSIGPHKLVIGFDVGAQTFGRDIFVEQAYIANRFSVRSILAHELEHVRQSYTRGGFIRFSVDYCQAFWDSNFSYRENALEEQAYTVQETMDPCLVTGSKTCKSQ